MSATYPHNPPGDRHLNAAADIKDSVESVQQGLATVTNLMIRTPRKPSLRPLARLDVEQARKFLIELDTTAASTSPLLAMFLLGRCAEHAQALLDVLDAVVAL